MHDEDDFASVRPRAQLLSVSVFRTAGEWLRRLSRARLGARQHRQDRRALPQHLEPRHLSDRLLSVRTPVAEKAAIHGDKMANGVMEMRPLSSLTIAPGAALVKFET